MALGVPLTRLGAVLLSSLVLAAGAVAHDGGAHEGGAHPDGDLVFFLSAEGHRYSRSTRQPAPDLNEDAALASDIVLSLTRGKFRLFGEYLLTSEEHDLERFQLGYEPVANTVVWLGRFHQPASAWNLEHHHGRYLQTSVTRPAVELWEDERGMLPQHLAGLLVDSRLPTGEGSGWHLSAGVGLGPRVEDDGLDPPDLLHWDRRGRRNGVALRVAFLPDFPGASQVGMVGASYRMPVTGAAGSAALDATALRTDIVGAFLDWRENHWRALAAAYGVHLRYEGGAGGPRTERFATGYLQIEAPASAALTAYGRLEGSAHALRSTYVTALHPEFVTRRNLLGLRWDFRSRQALTIEGGRGATPLDRRSEIRVQWSAAFP